MTKKIAKNEPMFTTHKAQLCYSPGAVLREGKAYFRSNLLPLTEEAFKHIVNNPKTERLVEKYRHDLRTLGSNANADESKHLLDILCLQGSFDLDAYNQYCRQCVIEGRKPKGHRNAESMKHIAQVMIDLDHVESPRHLWEHALAVAREKKLEKHLLLAHITPSGDGLRIVAEYTPKMMDMELKDVQAEWCRLLDLPSSDSACKDISRGSFAPKADDILHLDNRLFSPTLLPQKERPSRSHTSEETRTETQTEKTFPTHDEMGNDLKELAHTLITADCSNGIIPVQGERHTLLMRHAPQLARKCEYNPEWLAQVLPSYGLGESEIRGIAQWACDRPLSSYTSAAMKQAVLSLAVRNLKAAVPPSMPSRLPPSMETLLKGTPDKCRAAVAQSVFTALTTYLHSDVVFQWTNNLCYTPSSITVCYARHAMGKSSIKHPTDVILAPIKERGKANEQREREWRNECNRRSKNQARPLRPEGLCQQILPPDITQAAFTQKLLDADGLPVNIYMDELEQLLQLTGKSHPKHLGPILRVAWDCGDWGQIRVSSEAVNGMAKLNLKLHANTTPEKASTFFSSMLTDGTFDRITFTTITEKGRPVYGDFGAEYAESVRKLTLPLETAHGKYVCEEALAWAIRMEEEQEALAEEMDCRAYEGLYPRAIQNAFYRAMTLYLMEGCQWTQEIEEYSTWSLEHDLWCKWNLFGQKLIDAQKREDALFFGSARMKSPTLEMLPHEFTVEDVEQAYVKQNKNPERVPHMMRQWKRRGRIVFDKEKNLWRKCA